MWILRRGTLTVITLISFVLICYLFLPQANFRRYSGLVTPNSHRGSTRWSARIERNPVRYFQPLPSGNPTLFPAIQAPAITNEDSEKKSLRLSRLAAIKSSFQHSWRGYHDRAWLADEVTPVSGGRRDTFGHWSATLVDSLDTLWITGMSQEFDEAVQAVASIDFEASSSDGIDVFETTIRYLGGMLSAYELSGRSILLQKAEELGHMLYAAFDTPSRMPVRFLEWKKVLNGADQEAASGTISANVGSLGLEFTKLSQLTGNPKFYDAIQRITDVFAEQQDKTEIPGLWPVIINTKDKDFATGDTFTFGGMADSLYEYTSKMHVLLGGLKPEYGRMYEKAIDAAKKHLFFRPMDPKNQDLLISGTARTEDKGRKIKLDPEGQHLGCFTGGMVGMGSRIFRRDEDLNVARKLADGCFWAYDSLPSGIMPEIMVAVQCPSQDSCPWNDTAWHNTVLSHADRADDSVEKVIGEKRLPRGFADIRDHRYILRPEAIESIFYMYRITGDTTWQDKAWKMYTAIDRATKAQYGYSAIADVTAEPPPKTDSMESFWTAETLKYLYLIFSDVNLLSLDEWVLNTEAHPLRRMVPSKKQ